MNYSWLYIFLNVLQKPEEEEITLKFSYRKVLFFYIIDYFLVYEVEDKNWKQLKKYFYTMF